MIQRRGGSRLPPESFERLRVSRQFIRQEFQRNVPAKVGVLSLVNHSHASADKPFDDAVVREGFANQRIGGLHALHILGCKRSQVNERDPGRQPPERWLARGRVLGECAYRTNDDSAWAIRKFRLQPPMKSPPFGDSHCPVKYELSSEARKRAVVATSRGCPERPIGTRDISARFRSGDSA